MNNLSEAYWMPFTARNGFRKEPRVIVGAEGCHYTREDGRKVLRRQSLLETLQHVQAATTVVKSSPGPWIICKG